MRVEARERGRLMEARLHGVPWRKWGPYLSERQWGTVREDYSQTGNAWDYFSHDHARSRTYRSGEDGIAGFCDEAMRLCFAVALWNGKDPILKERLFGLTNHEGNHGEDVKEYYYYLDSTPTHSYARMLYKYPQAAFPYDDLVQTNRSRNRQQPEYELIDTGVFGGNRYFDVFVEYAKAAPEDILIRISAINRGPEPSVLYVLPHLWFRNTWWEKPGESGPMLSQTSGQSGPILIIAEHPELGRRNFYADRAATVLFTNNETNLQRLFGMPNPTPFVKDGINNFLVLGQRDAINRDNVGTKAAPLYQFTLAPGATGTVRLRLTDEVHPPGNPALGPAFDAVFTERRREADDFYANLIPTSSTPAMAGMVRQGFAGMLWSKQVYIYEVTRWLQEHGGGNADGPVPVRNSHWFHMASNDVISMPDKWEYPWFAAWDLAFHTIPLTVVDPDFATQQLDLLLRERYLHPNGQLPAYEWNFNDVNPPVHAWATILNYRLAKDALGDQAVKVLKTEFHKLLLNFTWWVNRKDRQGRNVFEGGFLGLDNIGVFDRSAPLPTGGCLEQADGTAWMALFAQNMLEIAIEISLHDSSYEELAVKFYQHFVWIASSLGRLGDAHDSMWDEEDGFYYDVLKRPDGSATRLKVRSMVGLLPLCAVTVYPEEVVLKLRRFSSEVAWFNHSRSDLLAGINPPGRRSANGNYMLSILNEQRLRRVLARLLDPNEFLSDYGIRSLSRYHLTHPYVFWVESQEYRVSYLPGESDNAMFGGNSNWRGPIWMPMNTLLIRALLQMFTFYGHEFKVECPTGSGNLMTLFEVAHELTRRIGRIFLPDANNRRAVHGDVEQFQKDPHWRDYPLFYEYFHGDTGAGLGASHQTGWTGLAPTLVCLLERLTPDLLLEHGLSRIVGALRKRPAEKPEPIPQAAQPAAQASGHEPNEDLIAQRAARAARRTHLVHSGHSGRSAPARSPATPTHL